MHKTGAGNVHKPDARVGGPEVGRPKIAAMAAKGKTQGPRATLLPGPALCLHVDIVPCRADARNGLRRPSVRLSVGPDWPHRYDLIAPCALLVTSTIGDADTPLPKPGVERLA